MGEGRFLALTPPLPLHSWLFGKFPGEWVALQMVREEGGGRVFIFRPSICLGAANPPSSPRRLPAPLPGGLQVRRQMPFPSWPAVKPVSWWLCMSPCDLGQMVPVTISRHSALTDGSLTRVPVHPRWGPRAWHPALLPIPLSHQPSGLHTPTPRLSAQHPPVSPNFPRREAPQCSR